VANDLSVVVARHAETPAQLEACLRSVAEQQDVDFSYLEVIVVDDAGRTPVRKDELTRKFPNLTFAFVDLAQNSGPGAARNAGKEIATGKYVTFLDSDDYLANSYALALFDERVRNSGERIYETLQFVERTQKVEVAQLDLHGKFFLRQFLEEERLDFHPRLFDHEDWYFMRTCLELSRPRRDPTFLSYVWTINPTSFTQGTGRAYYEYEFAATQIYPLDEFFEWLVRRGMSSRVTHWLSILDSQFGAMFDSGTFSMGGSTFVADLRNQLSYLFNKWYSFANLESKFFSDVVSLRVLDRPSSWGPEVNLTK
jgi:glycosyltransferase involved in cell wall biosynthesis